MPGLTVLLRILLGSGQRHVETTRVIQEADALMLIGTDTRENDEVLLSALEGVHAGNFHLLQRNMTRTGMRSDADNFSKCYID